MTALLLTAFIGVPVLEIVAFIEIGGWIGLWPTIGVVVATAVAGTMLVRIQGMAVLRRFQESVARGQLPVEEAFHGLCLLVAGVLLLTPGFFTDTLGFLLFVPPLRLVAGRIVWRWLASRKQMTFTASGFDSATGRPTYTDRKEGITIEGEFKEEELPSRNGSPPGSDARRDA